MVVARLILVFLNTPVEKLIFFLNDFHGSKDFFKQIISVI